jgi:hypothetical protein
MKAGKQWGYWHQGHCVLNWRITLASAPRRVISPIARCAANHFNPVTAKHDLDIVAVLGRAFGDFSMGVYTEVMAGREIAASAPHHADRHQSGGAAALRSQRRRFCRDRRDDPMTRSGRQRRDRADKPFNPSAARCFYRLA